MNNSHDLLTGVKGILVKDFTPKYSMIELIENKETCYKMMVAAQITDTNIQKAEDVIKNSVDYIFEKINER